MYIQFCERAFIRENSWKCFGKRIGFTEALESIGKVGGPRCCKRDSYLAILAAIDFAADYLNVHMGKTMPVCTRSKQNNWSG